MFYLLMLLAVILSGCSTPYQTMGWSGGVDAERMTTDTYRIVARGNGYTSSTTIQDYTVLKAAETTKQAGGTHFMIVGAADASRTGTIVTPGQAQTTVSGNTAMTTYTPAQAHSFIKPGQDTYIKVVNVLPGQAPPPGAISADEVIQFVGPRAKKPQFQL
ncbi:MAG: hypothetical protein EKK41_21140 [Hyphomicrobiales bacterium]|nr:MAG: hypothetical protein EKK41_21140 [Hyphomicrobiales bacterium]